MRFRYDMSIGAPIVTVFEHLADENKQRLWMNGLEKTEILSGSSEEPVGLRFRQSMREGGRLRIYEGEIMAFHRPYELRVKLNGSGFDVDVKYNLIQVGGETKLSYCADVFIHSSIGRLLGALLRPFSKTTLTRQMQRLKQLCEG